MAQNSIDTADPRNRKLIIKLYEERGERYVKAEFGVTRKAISRWRTLQREIGSLSPHFKERGRDRALTPPEIRKLERALLSDPYLSNRELATIVGNRITPRAAGNYINNSAHRFITKLEQLDVETAFTQRHADEGKDFIKKLRRIPLDQRVYLDETWIGAGIRRRKGRFPSGSPAWTPRNRKYPRKTVISAIRQSGWIAPSRILDRGSMTTTDFEEYVREVLAPRLQRGDVVLWDMLGKSGRARNPTALHFSPNARAEITARGARLLILPPAGKLLNPLEPLFGEAKRLFEKEVARLTRICRPSQLTFQQLVRSWHGAERQLSGASFARAFRERANGQEFHRVCQEKGLRMRLMR